LKENNHHTDVEPVLRQPVERVRDHNVVGKRGNGRPDKRLVAMLILLRFGVKIALESRQFAE